MADLYDIKKHLDEVGDQLRRDEQQADSRRQLQSSSSFSEADIEAWTAQLTQMKNTQMLLLCRDQSTYPQLLPRLLRDTIEKCDQTVQRMRDSIRPNHDEEQSTNPPSPKRLQDWIDDVKRQYPTKNEQDVTTWRIDRKSDDFLEAVHDKYSAAKDHVLVRPLRIVFEGETGIDGGALTRSFFHQVFESLSTTGTFKDCPMMTGDKGHIIPDHTTAHLDEAYVLIGKAIVHAVLQGCRGLLGFSPAIRHYLVECYGKGAMFLQHFPHVSLDDVADAELRNLLNKLSHRDESLSDEETESLVTWQDRCGCRVVFKDSNRSVISQQLLINYTLNMRLGQIDAIAAGLKLFGLLDFLRDNASDENTQTVFPSVDDITITPTDFLATVITRGDGYDEQTMQFFRQFLDDLHAGQVKSKNVSDLVLFLSGSPYLPSRVVLSFYDSVLPVAHACYNELQLPTRHRQYSSFFDKMTFAVSHVNDFSLEASDED